MRGFHRNVLAGVSLAAVAAAAPLGLATVAENTIRQELASAGFDGAAVNVAAYSGKVTIEGLNAASGPWSLSVGRISGTTSLPGLVSPAFAQANSFTIENVVVGSPPATMTIPKIAVEGASFGKDDWAKIFANDAGMPERIRGMNAKSIRVPEIAFRIADNKGHRTEYTMKDVVVDGLEKGRIAVLSVGETPFRSDAQGMVQDGVIKRSEIKGLDLAQGAHVWFDKAKADEKPAPIYDSYLMEGMTSRATGAVTMDMNFGKVSSGALRFKPLASGSMSEAVTALITLNPESFSGKTTSTTPPPAITPGKPGSNFSSSKPAPAPAPAAKPADSKEAKAAAAKAMRSLAELADAMEDDGTIGENMQVKVGEGASSAVTFSIAKFAATYGNGKTPASFMLSDMNMKAPDNTTARLAQVGVTGFSYAPTIRGIAEMMEQGESDMKNVDPRKFMPRLGQIVIKGLDVDAPDPKAPKGVKPERINLKLGQFIIDTKNEVKGIPTDITLGIDNLALKLPEKSSEEGIKMLKALGYSALDMSAKIAAKWDETAKEVAITDVSVGGVGMGTAKISGRLGNIGREVFEADPAMMQVALLGATAKAVSVKIENTGLAEKLLAMQARDQGRTAEDIKKDLGSMAAMGIPAILGPSDEAKELAGAVSRFLARPKGLTIDLTAKNAGGVGIPDMATLSDPQAALKLVNVKAKAAD